MGRVGAGGPLGALGRGGGVGRRRLLLGGLGLAGLAGLPWLGARAASGGSGRRFVFVVNSGGWDPLFVFAPLFGKEHVEMEEDATLGTAGGIPFVDHPDRPSVAAFFAAHHARSLVLNGLLVPSVAHPPSLRALLTGATETGTTGDWASRLAAADTTGAVLPGVVLSGASYPGVYAPWVARSGEDGQLDRLLGGTVGEVLDTPATGIDPHAEALADAVLAERAAAWSAAAPTAADRAYAEAFARSHDRARSLKATRSSVTWGSTATWTDQVDRTVEILAAGLARCVSMSFRLHTWDTHSYNDPYQSENFEGLFAGLLRLCDALDTTPGPDGAALAEDTVVVVLSEMGRTPLHNGGGGRDHWPYTSALLWGPGLHTDRVVGGHDEDYNGLRLDFASAEPDEGGELVRPADLGATLLALGGVDPAEVLPDATPLGGVLR